MSLLSICRTVLAQTGWPVMDQIASNSDGTAQQIFAIANSELQSLSELFSWPQLEVEYNFSTVAAQGVYLFPSDFRVLAAGSVFDAGSYSEIKGSTGLQFWELLKYGKLSNVLRPRYKFVYPLGVAGIEITPAPTGISPLVAVYYTKNYAMNASNVGVTSYMQDGDVARIPERYVQLGVMWRFRRAKGLDFSAELAEYNATVQTQFSKYAGSGEIPIGGPRGVPYDLMSVTNGYVREGNFG